VSWPWLTWRSEPAWAPLLLWPLDLASLGVATAARLHRAAYERGWRRRCRLPCAVVSIGNLTLGGSGKTPMAAWLAGRLLERDLRVALASRGYGRRRPHALEVVSDGRHVLLPVDRAGDEPLVLAAHAPGVPVLVAPDRGLAGWRAVGSFDTEALVLDDGFQHHRLARDLDIVLVDGEAGFGNRRVFPRGPLRESMGVLSRAHALVVVDGPLDADAAARLARFAPGARRYAAWRRPVGLRPLAGRAAGRPFGCVAPPDILRGREVGVIAGLASPRPLERCLESLGARVVARRIHRDHHRYRARDLRGLGREAPLWITTEKDAFKMRPEWAGRADVQVLAMEIDVEEGDRLADWAAARVRDAVARHRSRG